MKMIINRKTVSQKAFDQSLVDDPDRRLDILITTRMGCNPNSTVRDPKVKKPIFKSYNFHGIKFRVFHRDRKVVEHMGLSVKLAIKYLYFLIIDNLTTLAKKPIDPSLDLPYKDVLVKQSCIASWERGNWCYDLMGLPTDFPSEAKLFISEVLKWLTHYETIYPDATNVKEREIIDRVWYALSGINHYGSGMPIYPGLSYNKVECFFANNRFETDRNVILLASTDEQRNRFYDNAVIFTGDRVFLEKYKPVKLAAFLRSVAISVRTRWLNSKGNNGVIISMPENTYLSMGRQCGKTDLSCFITKILHNESLGAIGFVPPSVVNPDSLGLSALITHPIRGIIPPDDSWSKNLIATYAGPILPSNPISTPDELLGRIYESVKKLESKASSEGRTLTDLCRISHPLDLVMEELSQSLMPDPWRHPNADYDGNVGSSDKHWIRSSVFRRGSHQRIIDPDVVIRTMIDDTIPATDQKPSDEQ